jgi:hypothetical protein
MDGGAVGGGSMGGGDMGSGGMGGGGIGGGAAWAVAACRWRHGQLGRWWRSATSELE